MKRSLFVWIVLAVVVSHGQSSAQVFYEYPGAPVIGVQQQWAFGPYLSIGDNELLRFGGYGRLNMTPHLDVGVEVLVDDVSGNFRSGAGLDAKLNLFPPNSSLPFDLSVNAGLGFVSGDNTTIVQAPVGGIISSPFRLNSGRLMTPFMGVYLLIVNTEVQDNNGNEIFSDTDLDVEMRTGLRYTLNHEVDVYGSLHLGRDTLFLVGFNFGM